MALQYADVVAREEAWLAGPDHADALAWWARTLDGATPVPLPVDRPAARQRDVAGASCAFELPAALVAEIRAFARDAHVTPYMTLLAGFVSLLGRVGGHRDVVVATPVGRRDRPEHAGAVGYLANTVAVRADLGERPTLRDAVARVRDAVLASAAHQALPIERVLDDAPSRAPLYDVLFAYLDEPLLRLELPGVTVERLPTSLTTARTPLALWVDASSDRLRVTLEYATARFDPATVESLGQAWVALLTAAVAAPDQPLALLPVAEPTVPAWPDSGPDDDFDTLLDRIDARLAADPDALVAIESDGRRITAAHLSRRADAVAAALQRHGVGVEDRVVLAVDRDGDALAAMLGVWRAGAAYVHLDPAHPPARRRLVVADARPAAVICAGPLDVEVDAPVIALGALPDGVPTRRPLPVRAAAYVKYTSGTTGQPKGVVVEHASLVVQARAIRAVPGLRAGDRILLLGSLAFDISVVETVVPLAVGAVVVIGPQGLAREPDALLALLQRERVDVLQATPSTWQLLCEAPGFDALRVRAWCGAEALVPRLAERLVHQLGEVHNLYGPTETTVWATARRLDRLHAEPWVGRPLPAYTVQLLDANGLAVPQGAVGEVCVGGPGVARGYRDRPDLTAERYVPDPTRRGARLYRTGDLGRLRADGVVQLLGRADHQVKVRGVRLELGEVEAALSAHPGVATCAATTQRRGDDVLLVAHVTPADAPVDALRAWLAERLPDAMVPVAIAASDALPRNPNGKIDRRALPEVPIGAVAPQRAADGPLEARLLALWREVLGLPGLGVDDDFLASGGTSLAAVRLAGRIRRELSAELSVAQLFEARTVAAMARLLGAAPPQPVAAPAPAVTRLMSPQQRRIWLLQRITEDATYNVPSGVRLRGALDVARLERAFEAVVARHEPLRTTFPERDGQPVPTAHPPGRFPLPVRAATEAEIDAIAVAEADRPFDLEVGPVVRAVLLALGPEDHLLLVTVHHVVADGWSMGVLVRDLGLAYDDPASLPPLPTTYAEHVARARPPRDEDVAWWRERLSGVPAAELPTDRPRPAVQSGRGATLDLPLPAALMRDVAATARTLGTTPFVVCLAAFRALLRRTSGQADLAVGSPLARREEPEVADLVGLFIDTLAVRTDISGLRSLREIAERVQADTIDAFAHQDVPFERIVEAVVPERDTSRSPIVQILFTADVPLPPVRLGALRCETYVVPRSRARLDLTVYLTHDQRLELEYATDLFDAATMAQLGRQLLRLLAAGVAEPDRDLATVGLLDDAELAQLHAFNATAAPRRADTLQVRLAEQAARTPDAPALTFAGETRTYRRLDADARALAAHLREQGVGPEVRVGVCADRSFELLVALLGVLYAGAAYVPLDPSHPEERLAWVAEDARVALVLAQPAYADRFPRVVRLDALDRLPPSDAPPTPGHPEQLVYVLYTSGSTGRPKGAMNPHRAVVNRLDWAQAAYALGERDVMLQKTTYAFDVSVWELFWPLMTGAHLVIAAPGDQRDPARLAALIDAHGVTAMHFVPSMLSVFLAALPEGAGRSLRLVVCSGEALPPELRDKCRAALPQARLENLYGPTECAVEVTRWSCTDDDPPWTVPIGHPIANVTTWVLDEQLLPVAIGVPGELYLGGVGVGRGYLGRPDLTAERFVPDPTTRGGVLYRTGDRVRWRRDGALEFLGRLDHQVKLRGYRIELGEIESALVAAPGVREAAAAVHGELLYAWVTGDAPDEAALQAHLAARLPEYMVPARIVGIDALPLSPNGKLDRRALPLPAARAAVGRAEARTETERVLLGLFRELLGAPDLGIDDDFFRNGGHSLLAAQLVARVRAKLGVTLSLGTAFKAPTVARLAEQIDGVPAPAPTPPAAPAEAPLSLAQEQLWFLDRLHPGDTAYVMPLVVHFDGALDAGRLQAALQAVVDRHDVLRTTVHEVDGAPVARVAAPGPLPMPVQAVDEADVPRAVADVVWQPFDLARGPLFRAALLRCGPQRHVLALSMHHLVSDGASFEVLLGEVAAHYAGAALPPLPLQYADYALAERTGPDHAEHVAWWAARLRGVPALELPLDRPRPPVRDATAASIGLAIPGDVARAVAAGAEVHGVTPYVFVLAAFLVALHRTTGQRDLCVATPVARRDRPELQALMGFFVNTVALRVDLTGARAFSDAVERVRDAVWDGLEHHEAPLARVVEAVQPARDPSRPPLVQAMFLHAGASQPLTMPGLTAQRHDLPAPHAKFDLTLSWGPHAVVEYAAALFEPATVERLVERVFAVVRAGATDPTRPLHALPVLSPAERQELVALGDGGPAPEVRSTLIDAFRAQAAQTPDAVALWVEDEPVTYAALRGEAERIGRRLVALGAGPGRFVGLHLARGRHLVPAVLGVLASGAAYVPLDPAYPLARRRFVLEDAQPAVIVTDGPVELDAPAVLDLAADPLEPGADGPPAQLDDVAYLVYTSGSTGRPKAVAIPHRAAMARVAWGIAAYDTEERSGVFAGTSLSFDLSVFELFVPLCSGGTVVLGADPLAVARHPARDRVRLLNTVPSAMRELVATRGVPASVRTVNLAGEALPASLVDALWAQGVRRVVNLYGPSEDTTYSTASELTPGDGPPPIGRPLPGTTAWIVDDHGELLPRGAVGELRLGGAGQSRGYLGRPAQTAERFVPDPLGHGARLYRTGDLARWGADGQLAFVGRADHQVKLRGFRIELGEVEAALQALPAVRAAVVAVRDERLVAYVVADGDDDLRAALAARLPDPLVPAQIVRLDALPLTANGKVDRKALPDPAPVHAGRVPLRTDTERTVARVWAEVLGVDEPGGDDDFFALGGHSLRAVRVVARLSEALGVELPLRALFDAPTVAGSPPASTPARPRLEPIPPTDGAVASFAQQRLWFLAQLDPTDPSYHLPFALRLRGALDEARLAAALDAVVTRHEPLPDGLRPRRRCPRAPAGRAGAGAGRPAGPGRGRPRRGHPRGGARRGRRPFDLARGPLLRARLVALADDDRALLLTLHHVAADGWSLELLVREILALYRGEALPALPVRYADFAAWQRERLSGERLQREEAWWRDRLAGAPTLPLPVDRRRPAVQDPAGASVGRRLPEGVDALARRLGVTPFVVLLSGLVALLQRVTGLDDLVVGTPVANRERAETHGLVGLFVNTLVLRVDLAGDPSFAEVVARVRAASADALAHQELPFERVVDAVQPVRDPSRSPLFQVLFDVAAPQEPVGLPGLAVLPVEVATQTAKFDLAFGVSAPHDRVEVEYATALFDEDTVAWLASAYARVLAHGLAHPDAPVAAAPLLLPEDRDRVLGPWSGAPVALDPASLGERFARQAARTPDAPALVWRGGAHTYGELLGRVDALARALRARGVGPEVRVGICADRSPEAVVALLAVHRAGGAWVPLDPELPRQRLAHLAQDAGIALVLAQRAHAGRLPAGAVWLDEPPTGDAELTAPASPDQLCYVLYTSGSTGQPKGVLVAQRAIANRVAAMQAAHPLDPSDVVLHKTPASFDVSVLELFWPDERGAPGAPRAGRPPRSGADRRRHRRARRHHRRLRPVDAVGLPGRRPAGAGRDAAARHLRRRGPVARAARPLPGRAARRGAAQPLRAHRVRRRRVRVDGPPRGARRRRAHRPPRRQRDPADPRSAAAARPAARPGRAVRGRRGAGARLPRAPRSHRRALRPRPVRAGRRAVPTGDLAAWRPDGTVAFHGRADRQISCAGCGSSRARSRAPCWGSTA
ncbi:MAG: amino acid adenylation domain-containing protein [Myxococcota bacterium]